MKLWRLKGQLEGGLMLKNPGKNLAVIVLAAGVGKRMKSNLPKVLHEIGGKTLLVRTLDVLKQIHPKQIIIVVNPQNIGLIKSHVSDKFKFVIQKKPLGTADAVEVGLQSINTFVGTVAVANGDDTAFYKVETIQKVLKKHQKTQAVITFVTVPMKNPRGLGRIIRSNGKVNGIVEEKDATSPQRKIKEVNDGLYFFDKSWLVENITKLKPSPFTNEYYVTDLIALAIENYKNVQTFKLTDDHEWHGINTKEELILAQEKFTKRIHIMGVAGAGASAVAGIATGFGYLVTGCDLNPKSSYTKNLKIKIHKGHHKSHLEGTSLLVVSPAVLKFDPKNRELLEAKTKNIPVLTWQQFQGVYLQKGKFVIAVAGAYGKSTTTGMTSEILISAGLDPTCEVGATVLDWGRNFKTGRSKYYVCEADEYNDNFLNYKVDIAVILNIDWDHPDFFKNRKSVLVSYKKFVKQIKEDGTLVIADNSQLAQLAKNIRKDIRVVKTGDFKKVNLSIIGDFRNSDAKAALTVAKLLNLDIKKAKKTLAHFKGAGRRLEFKGEIKGVKVYDDYAVQPYTIRVTANALKDKFKSQKVWLVLEPHTFSRVEKFFNDFVQNLKKSTVDKILITDIFAAREKGNTHELSQKLARAVGRKARFVGKLEDAVRFVRNHINDTDLVLSMGAGNSYKFYDLLKYEY